MRRLTSLLDLAAAGLAVTGVAFIYVPAAFLVGAAALLGVSWHLTQNDGASE